MINFPYFAFAEWHDDSDAALSIGSFKIGVGSYGGFSHTVTLEDDAFQFGL